MTDDFLTIGCEITQTLTKAFAELDKIKNYKQAFETGETATLSLAFGNTTVYKSDFKADCRGEMIKAFLDKWQKEFVTEIATACCDLQTLLESEENQQ